MSQSEIELMQFPYSHYNEKARWALDWKGVAHTRTNLLPGPHMPIIKRLTGQTTVPVMRTDDEVIQGSAAIIDALERRFPEPALYPADPQLCEQALALQRHFDEEVGALVRRALFSVLLKHPGHMCRIFSGHRTGTVRALYRASFTLVSTAIGQSVQIGDQASVDAAYEATAAALDLVAEQSAQTGYLVGDRFSVADLCAAALLAPTTNPPDSPMYHPAPVPASVWKWWSHWEAHPGVAWVLAMYRDHRSPPGRALTHSLGGTHPPGG